MTSNKILVRKEQPGDEADIKNINDQAFGNPAEGLLVQNLRKKDDFIKELSLIAIYQQKTVGHILFTPIRIVNSDSIYNRAVALAPMAVLPSHHQLGIGSAMVEAGHKIARELGFGISVVLGHADYYPRFGYLRASGFRIRASFEVPVEAFMVYELIPGEFKKAQGVVEYPPEFQEV